ncbi:MAG TPA: hypothetical protein VFQ59_02665 [Candidatus Paceibacterota bacterium]|nr:hypothetical protein [Candidatus Paceibacterota bacterium]
MFKKIKHFFIETENGRNILLTCIIILCSSSSFLLGRLSKSTLRPGIEIEYPKLEIDQKASAIGALEPTIGDMEPIIDIQPAIGTKGNFFGSKKGKKYYPVGCSAGKNLKIENRIYFQTAKEAEEAGYTKSSSCR